MPRRLTLTLAAALGIAGGACSDNSVMPQEASPAASLTAGPNHGASPPALQRTVSFGPATLTLWPYLGNDVSGAAIDPVNLLFIGRSDPRAIRAALVALDGDRTAFGFPAGAPFDCRWSDTPSGDVETAWTDEGGWLGGTIQLQCGDFAPIRFHMRLFRSGRWTVGNAHFEVLIPGTADHQVLSWELAEQLVWADMLRTGLLDPAAPLAPSEPLNDAPSFRTIPAIIFNGLPADLQAIAAGASGPSAGDVPIATDGRATIFNVAGAPTATPPDVARTFTLPYNQVIPKPFCAGQRDFVYVQGPVTLTETARLRPDGSYTSAFRASGRLSVTPVNPVTGQPTGSSYFAEITEQHGTLLSDDRAHADSQIRRILIPENQSGRGWLFFTLEVDSRGVASAETSVQCTP